MTEQEKFIRLIQVHARKAGVDPDLAVGVARQESNFNPEAESPKGAIGLMQLMPDTARSLGVNPHDPEQNIRGGVRYLKQQQDRFGGDKRLMLAAYNSGPGAVEKYGGVPPYKETRGYVTRIMGFLGPDSAEAATPAGLPDLPDRPVQDQAKAAGLSALPDLPDQPPAAAPAAPAEAEETFPPLAEQEAAATQQALSGTREGYEVEVQSGPPGTFGRQASGGASQLEPPETSPMARPPGVLPPGVPRPAAEPGPVAVQTTPEGRIDYEAYLPSPGKEAAQRAAAELINITSVGQGARLGLWAGSRFGPIGAAVGTGLGAVGGAVLSRTANVKTGLEEPGALGDWLSIAPPALQAGWGIAKGTAKAIVKSSRGWKAVTEADEATKAAQKTYQEGVTTAEQQYAQEQADYLARTRAAQSERLQTVEKRRTVAEERHTAREARRQQVVEQRQVRAGAEAETATQQQAREYAEQVSRYEQAVTSQRQAETQARAIPARYTPETPSHVIYKKVAEIAPEAPVTLARTQEVAAELQDVLGQVPSLQPSRLQALLTDMRAARSTQSVKEVQRYLTDVGVLTRSTDSATRRTAKQLYRALHDDLAESASLLPETEAARDLLLQANATFRREMATKDLLRVISRAIKVGDDGIPRVAPGQALTRFDRLVEEDKFFAGSFTPDELTQVREDLSRLITAQKIPTRPGAAPAPLSPKVGAPYTPRPFQEPTIPAGERVVPQTTPAETARIPQRPQPGLPPEPVLPKLEPSSALRKAVLQSLTTAGVLDLVLPLPGPITLIASAAQAAELMAHMWVSPTTRPYMQYILNFDGSINKKALIAMAGGRAAIMAERKKEQEKGKTR